MPKYFLYARKSTDEDSGKQIHSIEDQIALVTEHCQKEGIEIEQVFTESQTAKVPGRPVFDQMLDQLKDREVIGIVCWHPDRLARNSVDGGRIIYLLDQGILQYLKIPTFGLKTRRRVNSCCHFHFHRRNIMSILYLKMSPAAWPKSQAGRISRHGPAGLS